MCPVRIANKILLCLTSSSLTLWAISLTSQSLSPWWRPSGKWAWNDSCLTFLFFKKFLCKHLELLNLLRNFSVLPMYCLWQFFTSKKVNYILRGTIQILRSKEIYALHRWFKLVCFDSMFANFTPWFNARITETFLGFKWRYFGPHQDVL